MRLLHLHVAEIRDGLLVQRPVVCRRIRRSRAATTASTASRLMSGIAAVSRESAREDRWPAARSTAGEVGDHAIDAAAAQLCGPLAPRRGEHDAKIDRFGSAAGVHG